MANEFEHLGLQVAAEHLRAEVAHQANVVLDLTTLSFLAERQLATPEEITQRIGEVHRALPNAYQQPTVIQHTKFVADILGQVYGPKPRGWKPIVIQGGLNQDQADDPAPQTDPKK